MQSNAARAAVAVVSIAVVVILLIVLSGGDDEGTSDGTVAQATTTTTGNEPVADKDAKPEKPEQSTVPLITVVDGQPEDGVADLSVDKGEEVAFEVESDTEDEVHVHGYDIEQELRVGKPTEISFPADIDGVFEIELHGTGTQIAELTVNP